MLRALEYPNGSHLPLALSAAGLGWKTRARKGRGHKWNHHAVCYSDGNMLVTSWDPIYPASSDQGEAHPVVWIEKNGNCYCMHVILLTWPNQERGSQLARKAKRLAQVLLAQRLRLGGTRLRWSCRVGWIGSMDVSQNNSEQIADKHMQVREKVWTCALWLPRERYIKCSWANSQRIRG